MSSLPVFPFTSGLSGFTFAVNKTISYPSDLSHFIASNEPLIGGSYTVPS